MQNCMVHLGHIFSSENMEFLINPEKSHPCVVGTAQLTVHSPSSSVQSAGLILRSSPLGLPPRRPPGSSLLLASTPVPRPLLGPPCPRPLPSTSPPSPLP
ncbi:protein enabled homolog isoform X3 [Micropterus dolomieu]|uniref:protein enabled homolog isoform X3 n=1 Tax=Micropterus dolomieu TaxID=147949 RepID=UPI001E8DBE79|nr:protein enabled homolog isoform X3 [Micropterus dolomieu]